MERSSWSPPLIRSQSNMAQLQRGVDLLMCDLVQVLDAIGHHLHYFVVLTPAEPTPCRALRYM